MEFLELPIMQMMTRKLSWLSRRTDVIAQNVAHADTPHYRARDLAAVDFRELIDREAGRGPSAPRLTHVRHMTGPRPNQPFAVEKAPDRYETAIDGNDVNLEQQLTRLGETQLSYQATTNLYRKHLDMIRIALGRPGR